MLQCIATAGVWENAVVCECFDTYTHRDTHMFVFVNCGDIPYVMVLYCKKRIFYRPTPKPTPYRKLCIFTFSNKLILYDL